MTSLDELRDHGKTLNSTKLKLSNQTLSETMRYRILVKLLSLDVTLMLGSSKKRQYFSNHNLLDVIPSMQTYSTIKPVCNAAYFRVAINFFNFHQQSIVYEQSTFQYSKKFSTVGLRVAQKKKLKKVLLTNRVGCSLFCLHCEPPLVCIVLRYP